MFKRHGLWGLPLLFLRLMVWLLPWERVTLNLRNKIKGAIELFAPDLLSLPHELTAANEFVFVDVFALDDEPDCFEQNDDINENISVFDIP